MRRLELALCSLLIGRRIFENWWLEQTVMLSTGVRFEPTVLETVPKVDFINFYKTFDFINKTPRVVLTKVHLYLYVLKL